MNIRFVITNKDRSNIYWKKPNGNMVIALMNSDKAEKYGYKRKSTAVKKASENNYLVDFYDVVEVDLDKMRREEQTRKDQCLCWLSKEFCPFHR